MRISLWKEDLSALVIVAIAGGAIGLIDQREPQIVAETTKAADEKKEALYLSHPLGTTWILQAGNDAKGDPIYNPKRRHSMAADLTGRTK